MFGMNDDEQAIRSLVDKWMAATKSGDVAAVLDLMTDDVLFMTPAREPFGKEEFRATFEAMNGIEMDGQATIEELEVIGDWAFARNHIDLNVTTAESVVNRRGYTLTIMRKGEDRRWRLYRDANLVG